MYFYDYNHSPFFVGKKEDKMYLMNNTKNNELCYNKIYTNIIYLLILLYRILSVLSHHLMEKNKQI